METNEPLNANIETAVDNNTPKTKKPRLFRWALWCGLGISVISIALMFIPTMTSSDNEPVEELMYRLLYKSPWLLLGVVGIIMPIIEECIFRSWGNGKKGTGIFSVVLMAIFIGLSFNSWIAFILATAAGLALVLGLKDLKKRLFWLMIFSSLAFMVAHTDNYSGAWYQTALALVEKFGFGLLASYLVINHNLLWSIAFHILNNSFVCAYIMLSVNHVQNTPIVVENDNFKLEMRSILIHDTVEGLTNYFDNNDDTISLRANIAGVAQPFLEHAIWLQGGINTWNDSVKIKCIGTYSHPYCQLDVTFKTSHDYALIVGTMLDSGWIAIDTTYMDAYTMGISDTSLLRETAGDSTAMSYWQALHYVRNFADIPIIIESYNPRLDSLAVDGLSWQDSHTMEELQEILTPQGIVIEPSGRKMTLLTIRSTFDPLEN